MIICSAIKHKGVIYPGKRHNHCIATIQLIFNYHSNPMGFPDQGFIDEMGNYYDRKRAGKHAIKCGQIKELKYHKEDLFSEDLY